MTSRTWNGGTAGWFTASDWVAATGPSSVPLPGDSLAVAAGTLELRGADARQAGIFDAATVRLGAAGAVEAPTLLLSDVVTGHFLAVASDDGAGFATVEVAGVVAVEGAIAASAPGGTLTIGAAQAGATLYLLHGGTLTVTGGDTLHLLASVEAETTASVDAASSLVNDGTYALNNSNITFAAGASLTGTGTFEPGLSSSVYFVDNAVPATQTIAFNGPDGRLRIGNPSSFQGRIANFASGDLVDLTTMAATAATFDPASHLLRVLQGSVEVASIAVVGTIAGALATTSDGDGGTYVAFAGQPTRMAYEVAEGGVALGSDVVRATMRAPGGATIDGAGIRIGILSDSFDADGNADGEAAGGYLPANPDHTSAVVVLKDGPAGGGDEGRAMAELIHQVAPGARIDFYTAADGATDFAAGVAALAAAGCNIVVDDWSFFGEPFYQVSGIVDTAVAHAVAEGISYFTSAGNFGDASYEAAWNPTTTTLAGLPGPVAAMRFANGTPYQTITLLGGYTTYLTLEWDAAYPATADVADSLAAVLYDTTGTVVAQSTQLLSGAGLAEPAIQIAVTPPGAGTTDYRLAVYQVAGAAAVGQFKYVLFGAGAGTSPGGVIDDPGAGGGSGTVTGHGLVPGVNTVGAIQWPNSTRLGHVPVATEYFSSGGPGTLLFDEDGNRLIAPSSPAKVTFLAPDGENVAVPGFDGAFYGTSAAAPNAAAVAALMLQADPALTAADVTRILTATADTQPGVAAAAGGAGLIRADLAVQAALSQAACYASGTRLRTPGGERAIDSLRPGELVLTASGEALPVRWVGRRTLDCARHPRPGAVMPIRVAAGAMAPGIPARDVLLSPDHAVAMGGVLIPIRRLVNGATVRVEAVERVTYLHVELDRHDLVLAEGMAAESYLDTGNRAAFEGGGPPIVLHPDFARDAWAAGACAPQCVDGAALHAARAALLARAEACGHALSRNPALCVEAAGRRLHPSSSGETHRFRLPDGVGALRIRSRTRIPAHVDPLSDDMRALGVRVRRVALDRADVPPGDARRRAGWHEAGDGDPDASEQWTDGGALLDCGDARWLELRVDASCRYWADEPTPQRLKRAGR